MVHRGRRAGAVLGAFFWGPFSEDWPPRGDWFRLRIQGLGLWRDLRFRDPPAPLDQNRSFLCLSFCNLGTVGPSSWVLPQRLVTGDGWKADQKV